MEELLADPQQVQGNVETLRQLMQVQQGTVVSKQRGRFQLMVAGYTSDVEADLNSKAYGLFGSGIGRDFLQYLESITTQSIHPAGTNIEVLAHAEGARWLVAIIKERESVVS